ncbi:heavy metal translocating P-type ATPase [Spiroplasma sp. DGKH1]|uniref:heavy metal translocating P-type ATPase n=1 Tax=Spiroplasma sp. DGKH1 TaxID=3050074 RepID=UPI0034C60FC0
MKNKKEQTNHLPKEEHPPLEHKNMMNKLNDDPLIADDHSHHHSPTEEHQHLHHNSEEHHHNMDHQHDSQMANAHSEHMMMDKTEPEHQHQHEEHHGPDHHHEDPMSGSHSGHMMMANSDGEHHHHGHHEHHNHLMHMQDFYIPAKVKDWNKRSVANLIKLLVGCVITCALMLGMINVYPLTYLSNKWFQWVGTTVVLVYPGFYYYKSMFNELFRWRTIGMYTLIGIGSLIAYAYSIYLVFDNPNHYHLFFETAAAIITILLIGDTINASVQHKVTSGMKDILSLQVMTANLVTNNYQTVKEVNIKDINIGDLLLVKKGDKIPVDGKVNQGVAYINEVMLTGESNIIEKTVNDPVIGGTINEGNPFYMEALKVGNDTVLANILDKVAAIQAQKPRVQKIADKISQWFTPSVFILAAIAFLIQYFYVDVNNVSHAINIAIAVIIIACPCALGIATPLATAIGTSKAVKEGIIFNNAQVFEKITKIDAIAFDKTGTITTGELTVSKILGDRKNYPYIYNLELLSNHPIAKSIIKAISDQQPNLKLTNFSEQPGKGVSANFENKELTLISYQKAIQKFKIADELKNELATYPHESATLIALVINNNIENIIILTDTIRLNAKSTIAKFKKMNIAVYMISGDDIVATKRIADEVGIENYHANVSPLDKAKIIEEIQHQNKVVAYVGDGINDVVALKQSDFAISMSQGSEVAIQASDITIIKPDILNIYKAFTSTKVTRKIIWSNFAWAFGYNIIMLPLAMAGIIPPMISAITMGASNLTVLLNSLVFNLVKIDYAK